jgi:SAM-dependent methyltransferase
MAFSNQWDDRYRLQQQLSVWPWTDLVSYVMRYARPQSQEWRVLELGCGAGANIPFFQWLDVQYYAVEGSPNIVGQLAKKFPALKDRIATGDFTREIPFPGPFDLVVDRSSLTHNHTTDIKKTLSMIHSRLKPEGKFIGVDWFSTEHADFLMGEALEDSFTRNNFTSGQFADIGVVHFSTREHLLDLFAGYTIEILDHKIIRHDLPPTMAYKVFAAWNLVARKI